MELSINSWGIVISCMEIQMVVTKGDTIRLDKFVHLYHLKESKEYGYYELVPQVRKARIVIDLPSSFQYWKSRYFFVFGEGWKALFDDFWGEVPKLLHWWMAPSLGALSFQLLISSLFFFFLFKLVTNPLVSLQFRNVLSLRVGTRHASRQLLNTQR